MTELGAKKGKWKEEDVFISDKWTHTSPSPRLCLPHNTVLPTFSLSFSFRGIHFYYPGLNRDLPLLSSLSPFLALCSCLGHNLPLSSDIFTSAPHATAYQTSPITSSNPISDLPIPTHLTPNLASSPLPLTSPHLTSLYLPHQPLPLSSSVFPALTWLPCASSRSAATRLFPASQL